MSLTPGTRLALRQAQGDLEQRRKVGPYEILSPIGEGGMGEVYRARDPRLNRIVALKLLPAAAANDTERRERFEREAQAVAALNHPGIVTIYSVEEADGQFFLTMELVEGQSLADAMPPSGWPLDRLLKIAIAVADAVAAAHQKGITHRDLKPANIMLGDGEHSGRVKVLDFGLAKLADAATSAQIEMPTELATKHITGEGRILGTVAYMSPEQAEGKPIDARSDLFSLGVILYEMATGRRPFTGDTSISIISSIVKDTPTSVTELNPAAPRDLARIVRRALSKDIERRYQTAKDLRNDLEELKASLDSGELQTSAMASGATTVGAAKTDARHRGLLIAGAVLVLSLATVVVYQMVRGAGPAAPVPDLEMTQLTTSGIATRPAISPDGKYVAYVQQSQVSGPGGTSVPAASVWVRQVATSSIVQIVAPEFAEIGGLTITPDGSYVDYVKDAGGLSPGSLWRVSLLGGTPKKLVDGINTSIGWSPDGRRMAFVRHRAGQVYEVVVADADGGNARVLATRKNPATFDTLLLVSRPSIRPAWSPDGHLIALHGSMLGPTVQREVVFVDVATGAEDARPIEAASDGLEWLDAGSLVVNRALTGNAAAQLWRFAYPNGTFTRLTNDLTSYIGVSLTAARDSLVTARTDRRVAIWVSDGSGANAKEIVPATQSSGTRDAVAWSADRVLFTTTVDGHRSISSVASAGGTAQDAVSQGAAPAATSDGRTVVFVPNTRGLWKVTDGGRPIELIRGQGTVAWPRVTRDDRSIVFASARDSVQSLWIVSIDGGTPTQVTKRFASTPILSPDGKAVAFTSVDEQGRPAIAICPLSDCSTPRLLPLSTGAVAKRISWTPDSAGLLYAAGAPENLWVEPLDGKPPRQLTHFTDDRQIADAAFSRDGTHLAIARATTITDVLLIKGLKR